MAMEILKSLQIRQKISPRQVWLKQHEEDFSLFRASDNEMYVAKTEARHWWLARSWGYLKMCFFSLFFYGIYGIYGGLMMVNDDFYDG